jgi:hypothetical protein
MYKIIQEGKTLQRLTDNAFIPFDPANTGYQAYLKWLEEGNAPEPADEAPPPDQKMVGVEFDGVMCSATRDDQNGMVAVIVAFTLQKDKFQPTMFTFVNGSKLKLTAQNIQQFLSVWMSFRQSFFKVE